MEEKSKMVIMVEFSMDGLFGGVSDEEYNGYDIWQSEMRYRELLEERLGHEFLDAEVEVRCNICDRICIAGRIDHEEIDAVAECVDAVYQSFEWVVRAD